MKTLILSTAVLAVVSGLAIAQPHPNGYAVCGINYSKTAAEATVFIVDAQGNLLSSIPAGVNNAHGLVMDHNNTLLMATEQTWAGSAPSIHKLDPATGTNVGTLTTFPQGWILRDLAVGQNGNYYVTESLTDSVFKVDQSGNITTVAVLGDNPWGGMDIDIQSGDLLVQSTTTPDPLRLITRDGSTINTLGTGFDARYGMAQHIPSGDMWSSSGDLPTPRLYRLQGFQTTAVLTPVTGITTAIYSLKADRASAANQQLIGGACWQSCLPSVGGIYSIDLNTMAASPITTILPTTTDCYETEIMYRRNVHSNLTGQGKWDVGVRIPEDANKPYILAVSFTGVQLGLPLPSGRTIHLTPDSLTTTGLTIGLAPFFTGTAGTLDSNGAATAKLDVSLLGSGANGVVLWFLAITLDNSAPENIATITDPHVIKLEGL